MIKNIVFYKSLLVFSLFIWSMPSIANEINSSQCQLTVGQKVIDYGRIARSSIDYKAADISQLPPRIETVRLVCTEEIDPKLTIRGTKGLLSGFKFGQRSHLQINLDSFSVDGKAVPAIIIRNNVRKSVTQLEPEDIIQSQLPLKGKTLELVLSVIPSIRPNESIQPDDMPQSDDIHLDFGKNVSDSFSVISAFSSVACNPTISSGGIIDYNRIHVSHLNAVGPTVLPAHLLTFSIQCDAITNVAIRADSNRPDSLIDIRSGTTNISHAARTNQNVRSAGLGKNLPSGLANISDPDVAGLGLSGGKKIGGYLMAMPVSEIMLDGIGAKARYLVNGKPTANSTWLRASENDVTGGSIYAGANYFGYSTNRSYSAPQAFKNLTATIIIQAYISDIANLNLSGPIQLDGSSKIEIYYY